jgi:hypothetical protein
VKMSLLDVLTQLLADPQMPLTLKMCSVEVNVRLFSLNLCARLNTYFYGLTTIDTEDGPRFHTYCRSQPS